MMLTLFWVNQEGSPRPITVSTFCGRTDNDSFNTSSQNQSNLVSLLHFLRASKIIYLMVLFQLESRIPVTLHFTLTNVGKPAFHYHWQWDSENQLSISSTNTSGMISPQSKQLMTLQVTPLSRVVFSHLKLQIFVSPLE